MSDKVRTGRAIASFIIPPVGIITWALTKDKYPKKAKGYLYLGIAGVALQAIGFIKWKMMENEKKQSAKSNSTKNGFTPKPSIVGGIPVKNASPEQLAIQNA